MMGKWGKADFKGLKDLLRRYNSIKYEDFARAVAKELAARLLSKVIKRTPVGQYPPSTGMNGGTLRRGWTAESQRHAELGATFGGDMGASAYVKNLPVTKNGDMYEIEIINPVMYASYVEYGHRTRNHKGWVPGRFMLTISEQELEADAPRIIYNKMVKLFGGVV